jgi:hypothetical protein
MKHRKIDKSKTVGDKLGTAKIDKAALKAAIDKIKDRKRPDLGLLRMAQQAQRAKLRQKLGKQLQPLFAGAAFDARKIDKALTQAHAGLNDVLKKERAAAAKRMAPIVKQRQKGLANTRKALDQIKFQPLVTTPIPITTPYLIYATPVGMLHDTHVEPWNNWAKFTYSSDRNTAYDSVVVNFYFAWQNNSDYLAVINCSTNLLMNGMIEATADPGWFFPGSAWLEMWARLTVFAGATTINYQGTQQRQMGTVYTEAGYSEIGSPGTIESTNIFGTYALSCADIHVDPGRIVVFEVACSADWWIDMGGSITLDFDFDPAGYQVMCPALQVDLLTAPQAPFENVLAR